MHLLYCVDPTGCACPRPIPAHKAWIEVLWCTVVLGTVAGRSGGPKWAPVPATGLRSSGIKKECPEIDGRASCRWNLGCPCWLVGWFDCPGLPVCQSASLPACGRSVAVSVPQSRGCQVPGARCQAGSESGQLQVQVQGTTLRSVPPPCCMRGLQ
jgi:hypothetical protein